MPDSRLYGPAVTVGVRMIGGNAMRWTIGFAGFAFLGASAPALSDEPSRVDLLRQDLAAKVPGDWQLHVTTRDGATVAFATPPYQQAFDLWYDPDKLHATLAALCPAKDAPVWKEMPPAEILVLVPTVGGKTADSMRVACGSDGMPASLSGKRRE